MGPSVLRTVMLLSLVAGLTAPATAQPIFSDDFESGSVCHWRPTADGRIVGTITANISRSVNPAGESALGDVIADAQLAASTTAGLGPSLVAFTNPGGIRADLLFAAGGNEMNGEVTCSEVSVAQPFGNTLVAMDLSGLYLDALLEQQFDNPNPGFDRILQVSGGLTYTWSESAPNGSKVDAASIQIGGVTVEPLTLYRVIVNEFLAAGGDNFTALTLGTNRLEGGSDFGALTAYLAANSPVPPGPQDRITMIP